MTKDELIKRLRACAEDHDIEVAHKATDDLILEYLADPEIRDAYDSVSKWYA